jgi:hypothetical protein
MVKWLSKNWFKYSNHLEKYTLLLMSIVGFCAFLHLTYLTFYKGDESLYQTTIFYFFLLVCLAMAGMLIRKGMKMMISKEGLQFNNNCPEVKAEDITS